MTAPAWRALIVGVLAVTGCAHLPAVPLQARQALAAQEGGHLAGEVAELRPWKVLEDRDFVYELAFCEEGEKVAYSHLGLRQFQLGVWSLNEEPARLFDGTVNPHEFDVLGVAFAPDGQAVVTVARDGAVRAFSAKDGAALARVTLEEPLTAVAFHPGGQWLLVGSARGRVTALQYPSLAFAAELRVHSEEVRGLAVAPDGRVFTGGWDKSVAVLAVEEVAPATTARARFTRSGELAVVRASLDGGPSAAFGLDHRVPYTLIHSALASAAGLDVLALEETVRVPTALGETLSRVARGRTLRVKGVSVPVDVAVCDACLPDGVQGILGAPFALQVDVVLDVDLGEVVLTLREPATPVPGRGLALVERQRFTFDGFVNDLSLDAAGARLGLALTAQKAERTRQTYEREKRGEQDAPGPTSVGALVDAKDGRVLRRWATHGGIVATAGISPDGRTLVTGGWDNEAHLLSESSDEPVDRVRFGWSVRRARFSPDARWVGVAAWTPPNPLGDQRSDPAALLLEAVYPAPAVLPASR